MEEEEREELECWLAEALRYAEECTAGRGPGCKKCLHREAENSEGTPKNRGGGGRPT